MAIASKGRCKHGEFDLISGCPQCVSERLAEQLKEKLKTNIVKVKYISDSKAKVSAVDVAATEVEAFKDKVKTILAGSKVVEDKTIKQMEQEADESLDASEKEWEAEAEVKLAEMADETIAIALRPGEDIEVHSYFEESRKMLEYAEKRVIKTLDDAKLATDDLSSISRLKKAMEAKRKEALAPHEAQVKAIRDTYNYLMAPVLEAERITKEKQTTFLREQERIQQEQERINAERIKLAQDEMKLTGELTESVNLLEVQEAPASVKTDFGSSGLVDHWKVEVTDMAILPNEYKIPDMVMLNAIAKKYHDAKKIPGVRFYNEPYLATRTR